MSLRRQRIRSLKGLTVGKSASKGDRPGLTHDPAHLNCDIVVNLLARELRRGVRQVLDLDCDWLSAMPPGDALALEDNEDGEDHCRDNRSCYKHDERAHVRILRLLLSWTLATGLHRPIPAC